MDATLIETLRSSNAEIAGRLVNRPFLFLIIESRNIGRLSARYSLEDIDCVVLRRGKQRMVRRDCDRRLLEIMIADPWMSSRHARIERRRQTFVVVDENSTNGTRVNGRSVSDQALADGDFVEVGQSFLRLRTSLLANEVEPADLDASDIGGPTGMRTINPSLAIKFLELSRIIPSASSVMLLGPTGSGKEVMARDIHGASRRAGAFVPVNCGALPESLVESQFFGHKKGAFSGANEDRPGLVQSAHRGTLFLDEIGDMPLASQAALLRVLQEREVTPVGGTRAIPVEFRIVSATHRNIKQLVTQGKFREDLLARLHGFELNLPPLHERKEDFGILLASVLGELVGASASLPEFDNHAVREMLNYEWPRNIRELVTTLQPALALAAGGAVSRRHLGSHLSQATDAGGASSSGANPRYHGRASTASPTVPPSGPLPVDSQSAESWSEGYSAPRSGTQGMADASARPLTPEQEERRSELIERLRRHRGNISAVAREMGKVRSQVQRWIRRYGIDPEQFRE